MLRHLTRLPLLKVKSQFLTTIVLLSRLILMILYLNELTARSLGIETQTHETRETCRFGNELEGSGLVVLELDEGVLIGDDLVAVVNAELEELQQSEPLASHFVTVVCVDELIVVAGLLG